MLQPAIFSTYTNPAQAMQLRPRDSRMWCAMANCYETLERKAEAFQCYQKARAHGDTELALPRLVRCAAL